MDTPKIIWSFGHNGSLDFEQARQIISLGAKYKIDGLEIRSDLSLFTSECGDSALAERRQTLADIVEVAMGHGQSLGIWFTLSSGEGPFVDQAAGLEAQLSEFFAFFPEVDELVLALGGQLPGIRLPEPKRLQDLLKTVCGRVASLGKRLVIRPCPVNQKEHDAIYKALAGIGSHAFTIMEPTEAFVWNPFSPDNAVLKTGASFPLRAEIDCGSEQYGQNLFLACCPEYLRERLLPARERDVASYTMRADYGNQISPGTLNEINLVAITCWLQSADLELEQIWQDWQKARLGQVVPGLPELLEQTFEVIKRSLYVGEQPLCLHGFPDLAQAKASQLFQLFEPAANLEHLRAHPGVQSAFATQSVESLLSEKEGALAMAQALVEWFDSLAVELPEEKRREIRDQLQKLVLLAEFTQALVHLIVAHLQATSFNEPEAVDLFAELAGQAGELADSTAELCGEQFFGGMPARLRGFVAALQAEQDLELPRRKQLAEETNILDFVLCGLASEGHCLSTVPGNTLASTGPNGVHFRSVGGRGDGPISYTLNSKQPGVECRLELVVVGNGPLKLAGSLDKHAFSFTQEIPAGETASFSQGIPASLVQETMSLSLWSEADLPCQIAEIRLVAGRP
jgi:hypothetical protein